MREREELKTQRIKELAKVREYKVKPKNYPITMLYPLKVSYGGSQQWYSTVVIH